MPRASFLIVSSAVEQRSQLLRRRGQPQDGCLGVCARFGAGLGTVGAACLCRLRVRLICSFFHKTRQGHSYKQEAATSCSNCPFAMVKWKEAEVPPLDTARVSFKSRVLLPILPRRCFMGR